MTDHHDKQIAKHDGHCHDVFEHTFVTEVCCLPEGHAGHHEWAIGFNPHQEEPSDATRFEDGP